MNSFYSCWSFGAHFAQFAFPVLLHKLAFIERDFVLLNTESSDSNARVGSSVRISRSCFIVFQENGVLLTTKLPGG
jgi:hypothetical protein